MNYIKLLIAAQQKIIGDNRLNATHVSLYFSLFQTWNSCHFAKTFYINRQELMNASKIGSKGTYHKCLKDLDAWGYLGYFPSNNSYKGSEVSMKTFSYPKPVVSQEEDCQLELLAEEFSTNQTDGCIEFVPAPNQHRTSNEPVLDNHRTSIGQASVPFKNNNKQVNIKKLPNDRQAVLSFFISKGFGTDEGVKFLDFYQKNNWKTRDGTKIRDWQAVANSWMKRTFESPKKNSNSKDHLKISKEKNYEQPL